MDKEISPIIETADLLKLYGAENLILVDASNGKNARSNYEEKHLAGAIFVDIDTQLADIKDFLNGGRHPLPTVGNFAETLSNLGISSKSHVVIYDNANGANAAARFWWMLKSIGHDKVQVLNGGIQQAEKIGFPLSSTIEIPIRTERYKIENWRLPLADIAEVESVSENKNYLVIDVRSKERYNGETEPIDLIAGHIPGAINVPLSTNLDAKGLFLPAAELKTKYQNLFDGKAPENIIVHCGSGVTACHTILAMAYAGLEIPKLYVGSWSEWSRNNKTIATKYNGQ